MSAINDICQQIIDTVKELYNYTDDQVMIYMRGYIDCAEDNRQALDKRDTMLRDTVADMNESIRLLKLAVSDLNDAMDCSCCKNNDECTTLSKNAIGCFVWKHDSEMLALLEKVGDTVEAQKDNQ